MTIEEVADYLKLSRSKLYDMAQKGEIPCSKVAGRWRFFRPEVDEWMLRQRPAKARQ
jgi:excisionase family DNA binding protein